MSGKNMTLAVVCLNDASRVLAYADAGRGENSVHFADAMASLKRGVEALGLDLVPRKTPADLHAEAIAARAAEEPVAVTSEPCWDGRDDTSIQDDIWRR